MNEFETAVVNESSVFEPLKFYSNTAHDVKGTLMSFASVCNDLIMTDSVALELFPVF